jgi:hypothetical protein
MKDFSNVELKADNDHLYAMKGAILLHTSLEQVLFLDCDNVPVSDPGVLFEHPAYLQTGALFWPDFWKTEPTNPIFDIFELNCTAEFEQESGQLLIDKSRKGVVRALQLAFYFQRTQGIYARLLLGDKDTFRFAFRIINIPYHMVKLWLTKVRVNIASLGDVYQDKFCGKTMVQFKPMWGPIEHYGEPPEGYIDPPEPTIMFLHMNLVKDRGSSNPLEFIYRQIAGESEPNLLDTSTVILQQFHPFSLPNAYTDIFNTKTGSCISLNGGCGVSEPCTIKYTYFSKFIPDFQDNYLQFIMLK